MTIDDATPATTGTTRRARRAKAQAGDTGLGALPTASGSPDVAPETDDAPVDDSAPEGIADTDRLFGGLADDAERSSAPRAEWADAARPATALLWLETATVVETTRRADLDAATNRPAGEDVLADSRLRPGLLRARWLWPLGTLALCAAAYGTTMLVWPLHAVAPVVQAADFSTTTAATADVTWPAAGSAGVGIAGISSSASTASAASIASVTKVVTALMVLDRLPLKLGEQGPEYAFTYADSVNYWDYRVANQSSLDVPVGGVLTEYQMLQGTLLGSANNYVDRLARELWGSNEQFAAAAKTWLADRGLSAITVVTPSGFDDRNTATPEALLQLGERAMQNPVFAEIVGTRSVELPGAGVVENTNGMLVDAGVVGIKTGTLDESWNLLTAKDVVIGTTTVHLFAAVLGQPDDDARLAATRSLFTQVETALDAQAPAVAAGTVVGHVDTKWGTTVDIVVDEDADVVLWDGAASTASVTFALDDRRTAGDEVGTLAVNGPVDAATVDVSLAEDVDGPSPWWRLTHPLDLLGVAD